MENNEKSNASQILMEEQGSQLVFEIAGEKYSGYCPENAKHFVVLSENGKSAYAIVRNLSAEEAQQGQPEALNGCQNRYPHLQLPVTIIRNDTDTREFLFYPLENQSSLEELENVLFGKSMSLLQRLSLSLSLAAAVSELESVFGELSMKQLRMDAFWVDMKNSIVSIECRKLTEEWSEEKRNAEYEKMAGLGLMPPEWYENPQTDPVSIQGIRHFLAVCIFRFLCSEDPFDGAYTLREYPYRGMAALASIYGKNAGYILDKRPDNKNRGNNYIGTRAYTVFYSICPRLKRLFEDAFIKGIQDPQQRPSARAWVENQKNMVSWFVVSGKEWRIPDLATGSGTFEGTNYLTINNGITIPLVNEKCLYQFMFEPADAPVNERITGKVSIEGFCPQLVFTDGKMKMVSLHTGEENTLPGDLCGQISDAPWKGMQKG